MEVYKDKERFARSKRHNVGSAIEAIELLFDTRQLDCFEFLRRKGDLTKFLDGCEVEPFDDFSNE